MYWKKIVTVGAHSIGVMFDEENQEYVLVDNYVGERKRYMTYPAAIDDMQVVVCELLNSYFADIYEQNLLN